MLQIAIVGHSLTPVSFSMEGASTRIFCLLGTKIADLMQPKFTKFGTMNVIWG